MIPDWLGGLALLVLIWLPLWWLAGGRKPLTPRCLTVAAVAWLVLALDGAARGEMIWAAINAGNALVAANKAGWRSARADRAREHAGRAPQSSERRTTP